MSRKQLKRRAGGLTKFVIVGFFILVVACGVGLNAASAESSDEVASGNAFGFDEATQTATAHNSSLGTAGGSSAQKDSFADQQALLMQESTRYLDSGLQMIDQQESLEQQRLEEERVQALSRVETQKSKQSADADNAALLSQQIKTVEEEYELVEVDWKCGREAFITEWTARINAYLSGSPLAGYGEVFATAAWDNGVDPRWSPAIAYTESSRGSVCFLPYNAWGWGYRMWSDWTTAIQDHVAGLSDLYGYTLTRDAARSYCPPNSVAWYNTVYRQMTLI